MELRLKMVFKMEGSALKLQTNCGMRVKSSENRDVEKPKVLKGNPFSKWMIICITVSYKAELS